MYGTKLKIYYPTITILIICMLQVEPRTVKAIRVDRPAPPPTQPRARAGGLARVSVNKDCRRAVVPYELGCGSRACVQVWCNIHI